MRIYNKNIIDNNVRYLEEKTLFEIKSVKKYFIGRTTTL